MSSAEHGRKEDSRRVRSVNRQPASSRAAATLEDMSSSFDDIAAQPGKRPPA
jgi:hypothetical protein